MGFYSDYISSLIIINNRSNKIFKYDLVVNLIGILSIGTGLFAQLENWSFFDSFYYCVIMSITTGYGDICPKTDVGKMVTIIYSLISMNLFSTLLVDIKDLLTNTIHSK